MIWCGIKMQPEPEKKAPKKLQHMAKNYYRLQSQAEVYPNTNTKNNEHEKNASIV